MDGKAIAGAALGDAGRRGLPGEFGGTSVAGAVVTVRAGRGVVARVAGEHERVVRAGRD